MPSSRTGVVVSTERSRSKIPTATNSGDNSWFGGEKLGRAMRRYRSQQKESGVASSVRRQLLADLFLLGVCATILLLPAWIRVAPTRRLRVTEVPLESLVVEINSAPWYEWALLRGIGEARARRIVTFRAQHGPFSTIDDLGRVPGLPAGWVERARPHLTIVRARRDLSAR